MRLGAPKHGRANGIAVIGVRRVLRDGTAEVCHLDVLESHILITAIIDKNVTGLDVYIGQSATAFGKSRQNSWWCGSGIGTGMDETIPMQDSQGL